MIRFGDAFRIPGQLRVVPILIGVNVLSFVAVNLYGHLEFLMLGGVIPAEFYGQAAQDQLLAVYDPNLLASRPHPIVTVFWSMFLHGGFFHLLGNILFLYLFGPNVELHMGWPRFLLFYFACGAVAALAQVLATLDSVRPMIGASGAISALLGAYFALFRENDFRLTTGSIYKGNYRDTLIPFKALGAIWVMQQLFTEINMRLFGDATYSIGIFAHIGGFLAGLLLAQSGGFSRRGGSSGRRNFKVYSGNDSHGRPWGHD
jgi:membrane associated rhomboid family serine protease